MSRPGVNKCLEWDFIKVILTKNQRRSKGNKEQMRIRKSKCIKLDWTCCCTGKFNAALSLYRVLEIAFYFFKGFLEAFTRESIVTKVLQPFGVTMVCFLGQKSSLQFPTPQQRYRLFSRCFLHFLLVNLLLLASLEERSTHKELGCFLGVRDNGLDGDDLADKATGDVFSLFQGVIVLPVVQNTISQIQLRGIVYEIYVVSRNLVAELYIEIIQYVSYFTDRV